MKRTLWIFASGLCLFARGGDLKADAPLSKFDICRLAWAESHDGLGDPYPMLSEGSQTFRFQASLHGLNFIVIPASTMPYNVELDDGSTVRCQVPVSWKALETSLRVSIDPKFADARKITMIGGKPFGSEAKGGIYIRHTLVARDPTDVNLAWFLNAPSLDQPGLEGELRELLRIPAEQSLSLLKTTDLLQARGGYPIEKVSFTVGDAPAKQWAVLPSNAATLFPTLRFLPLGAATQEATIEAAWNASRILDLSTMNFPEVPCTILTCRQQVDDAFYKVFSDALTASKPVCVHLAYKGGEFAKNLVSTVCVSPANGAMQFLPTKAVDDVTQGR